MQKQHKVDNSNMYHSIPKIGVVGCGDWGRNIVRTLKEMGNLGGVADQAPTLSTRTFAETHQITFQSVDELLGNPEIQGISIATPSRLHFEIAHKALTAGKHVLVEKPLVYTLHEAETLIALAKQKNLTLMVGYLLLHHPAFQWLQQWVQEGKLGTIRHILSCRGNFGKFRTDENVVWDLAPHDLSMVLALYHETPQEVSLHQGIASMPGLSDIATLHLKFTEDRHADIILSRFHPFKEQALYVIGTNGMAVFDDTKPWPEKLMYDPRTSPHLQSHNATKAEMEYAPFTNGNPLQSELIHFVECIQGKAKCRSDAQDTLNILKILCNITA